MKVLTVRQPWASLIVFGNKNVENRTWKTPYRGELAIHAALSLAPFLEQAQAATMGELRLCPSVDLEIAPRGVILGTVDLVDVRMNHDSIWTLDTPFQWILENPKPYETPYPAAGKLGLWNLDVPS